MYMSPPGEKASELPKKLGKSAAAVLAPALPPLSFVADPALRVNGKIEGGKTQGEEGNRASRLHAVEDAVRMVIGKAGSPSPFHDDNYRSS